MLLLLSNTPSGRSYNRFLAFAFRLVSSRVLGADVEAFESADVPFPTRVVARRRQLSETTADRPALIFPPALASMLLASFPPLIALTRLFRPVSPCGQEKRVANAPPISAGRFAEQLRDHVDFSRLWRRRVLDEWRCRRLVTVFA